MKKERLYGEQNRGRGYQSTCYWEQGRLSEGREGPASGMVADRMWRPDGLQFFPRHKPSPRCIPVSAGMRQRRRNVPGEHQATRATEVQKQVLSEG